MPVEQSVITEAVANFKAGKLTGNRTQQIEALNTLGFGLKADDQSTQWYLSEIGKIPEEKLFSAFSVIPEAAADFKAQVNEILTGKNKKRKQK